MGAKIEKSIKKDIKTDKSEKKISWVECPRCEINYKKSTEQYCDVCKAELGLAKVNILLPNSDVFELEKLCPICNTTYIDDDEEICFLCAKERAEKIEKDDVVIKEQIEEIDTVVSDDEELISLEAEEEAEFELDDEEASFDDDDDFDAGNYEDDEEE